MLLATIVMVQLPHHTAVILLRDSGAEGEGNLVGGVHNRDSRVSNSCACEVQKSRIQGSLNLSV